MNPKFWKWEVYYGISVRRHTNSYQEGYKILEEPRPMPIRLVNGSCIHFLNQRQARVHNVNLIKLNLSLASTNKVNNTIESAWSTICLTLAQVGHGGVCWLPHIKSCWLSYLFIQQNFDSDFNSTKIIELKILVEKKLQHFIPQYVCYLIESFQVKNFVEQRKAGEQYWIQHVLCVCSVCVWERETKRFNDVAMVLLFNKNSSPRSGRVRSGPASKHRGGEDILAG